MPAAARDRFQRSGYIDTLIAGPAQASIKGGQSLRGRSAGGGGLDGRFFSDRGVPGESTSAKSRLQRLVFRGRCPPAPGRNAISARLAGAGRTGHNWLIVDDLHRSSRPQTDLEREAWPSLPENVLDILRAAGEVRKITAGDLLWDVGEDHYDLVYVESGSISIVDRAGDRVVAVIDAGNFVGELGMMMGQQTFYAAVVHEPGRVLTVPLARLQDLVATVPEVGDPLISAFAARRQMLTQWNEGGLIIVGDEADPAAARLRTFATRNNVPHRWVGRSDSAAIERLNSISVLPPSGTVIITRHNEVITDPSTRELAAAVGLDLAADITGTMDVLVVGAGPAGLASAVSGASEGLRTLVLDDTAVGGQAGTSSRIENYLGFPLGVSGQDLAGRAFVQAVKFGARIVAPRRATGLQQSGDHFTVTLDDDTEIATRSIILAGGVQYRRLPIRGIDRLDNRGIFYAATELEARSCRGGDVVIIGGGNSAGQAAMYLAHYAQHVSVVVRGDSLASTMSSYLSQRLGAHPRISVLPRTQVVAVDGDPRVQQVTLHANDTGEERTIPASGLFVMVGAVPRTEWLDGALLTDRNGFICTGRTIGPHVGPFETSIPGIFAVGDVRADSVKRVASAVGEGSVAISFVHQHLARLASGSSMNAQAGESPPAK